MANINGHEILFGIVGSVGTDQVPTGGTMAAIYTGTTDSIAGSPEYDAVALTAMRSELELMKEEK
ncbi:MAG: hypothetical protein J6J71_01460 [Prevotella sp.]|nr:hypothetical protein [Prevotella sp.]